MNEGRFLTLSTARPRFLALLLISALPLIACSKEATQLTVVVDSDFQVPSELQAIRVEIKDRDQNPISFETFVLTASAGQAAPNRLPLSFAVAPAEDQLNADLFLELRPLSTLEGAPIYRRRILTRFVEGRALLLPVFLPSACSQLTCKEDQTCSEVGCVPEFVDPLGLPALVPGKELEYPFDREAPKRLEICDGLDNDGNGLVDEGFVYEEVPGARLRRVAGTYTQTFGAARGPNTVALVWQEGPGEAVDDVVVEVLDLEGRAVAEPVRFKDFQPSDGNLPVWVQDRYLIAGRQRHYACGGIRSQSCKTYVAAVDARGALALRPTELYADHPWKLSFFSAGDQAVLTRGQQLEYQSITRDGTLGPLAGTVSSTTAVANEGQLDGDSIFWSYGGLGTSQWLKVTRLDGSVVTEPIEVAGINPTDMLVVDGTVHFSTWQDGNIYVVRLSSAGTALAAPTLVHEGASIGFLAKAEGQIFVLTQLGGPERLYFSRLSLDGVFLQPPTLILEAQIGVFASLQRDKVVLLGVNYRGFETYRTLIGCPR